MRIARTSLTFVALVGLCAASAACRRGSQDAEAPAAGTLRGQVFAADGRPIARAIATLAPEKPTADRRGVRTQSDSAGAFHFQSTPVGRYKLHVTGEGHAPETRSVELRGGETATLTLKLGRLQPLEGLIQDARSNPVSQAAVFAWPAGGQRKGLIEGRTGRDGRFALAVAPGAWTLLVEAPGFGTMQLDHVAAPGRTVIVRLDGEARSLGGIVVDTRGAEVAGARVVLGGPALAAPRTLVSGDDGTFLFHGVGFGRFALRASFGEQASRAQIVSVDEATGWLPPVKLALAAGARLEGRVRDDQDRALPGAELELLPFPSDDVPELGRADREGRFTFGPLAPGVYQLLARHPQHALAAPVELRLRPPRPTRVDLALARTAAIDGRVVDRGGRGIGGAAVTATKAIAGIGHDLMVLPGALPKASEAATLPAASLRRQGQARSATTESTGGFALVDLPPGRYEVEVRAPGRLPQRRSIELASAERRLLGDVELSEGIELAGRVLRADGAPFPGARVAARLDQMPAGLPEATTTTDESGRFAFRLAPGSYRVVAAAPRHAPAESGPVAAGGGAPTPAQELRLLAAEATLTGRVVDPDGRSVPRATVNAHLVRSPTPGPGLALGSRSADGSGRFRFSALPQAPIWLEAHHADFPAAAALGRPGEEALVRLVRPGGIEGDARDGDGAPIAALIVESFGPDGRPAPDAQTKAGTFRLLGLAPGRWKLRLSAPGYIPLDQTVEVPSGVSRREPSVRGLRVQLRRSVAAGPVGG